MKAEMKKVKKAAERRGSREEEVGVKLPKLITRSYPSRLVLFLEPILELKLASLL